MQLDLMFSHSSLHPANIAYIALFGIVGLTCFVIYDYRRQAGFFQRLAEIGSEEPLDRLGFLAEPVTAEQQAICAAWTRLYSRLRAEIAVEQGRGRDNVRMVSQWAHYMKSPVAVIDLELQKADRLAAMPEIPEINEALQSVAEENRRLSDSLQALLNMVRLEDFSTDLHIEEVDLFALVRRLINDNRRLFVTHHVYPKVHGDGDGDAGEKHWPHVTSDAKWLRFALQQIVNNAVKYSARQDHPGEVVFACRPGDGKGEIVLEIADNGIGIPPEDIGRVFTPFYTGSNGRAYPQSTGMGLYLASQACQRLGHRLNLQSVKDEGTHVFMHFYTTPVVFSDLTPSLTQK